MAGDPTLAPNAGAVPDHSAVVEVGMRLIGAALQILSTWALVRALTPEDAGGPLFVLNHLVAERGGMVGIARYGAPEEMAANPAPRFDGRVLRA